MLYIFIIKNYNLIIPQLKFIQQKYNLKFYIHIKTYIKDTEKIEKAQSKMHFSKERQEEFEFWRPVSYLLNLPLVHTLYDQLSINICILIML